MLRLQLGAAFLASALPPCSAARLAQDRSLYTLDDELMRAEIAQLGGYQEVLEAFTENTLVPLLVVGSDEHSLTFRSPDQRVAIETYPFNNVADVVRKRQQWSLEGRPAIGWSLADEHNRLARVEVVQEGTVLNVPTAAVTDVFDLPLRRDGLPYCTVHRSRDGWRTYVHAQAGDGPTARMVTWVFENGHYLFRVVDVAP